MSQHPLQPSRDPLTTAIFLLKEIDTKGRVPTKEYGHYLARAAVCLEQAAAEKGMNLGEEVRKLRELDTQTPTTYLDQKPT